MAARRRGDDDPDTVLSKKMAQALRHTGYDSGLYVSPDGFVLIEDLLKIKNGHVFSGFEEEDVERVVHEDAKNRFSLYENQNGLWVRANQGHTGSTGVSIEDDSLLTEILDSSELDASGAVCVHGTYWSCWELIEKEGLKTMERNHVHFATSTPESGEVISGMRADCEILVYLNVPKFLQSDGKLFRSSNNVLLTRGHGGVVSPEFFLRAIQRSPFKELSVGAAASSGKQNAKPSLSTPAVSLRPSGAASSSGYQNAKPSLSSPAVSLRPSGATPGERKSKPSLLS